MIVRIVRMSFESTQISTFKENFDAYKNNIRAYKGCRYLELLQDVNNECVFYTLSHWESSEHLEDYRQSFLFKEVWSKTKILFNDKPVAFSLKSKIIVQ